MTGTRSTVIETIADTLVERALALLPSRVLLVAVIGITASGKSTLAEELAQTLATRGRGCINIAVSLLTFYRRRTQSSVVRSGAGDAPPPVRMTPVRSRG